MDIFRKGPGMGLRARTSTAGFKVQGNGYKPGKSVTLKNGNMGKKSLLLYD